jgi:hypothetical protein
MTNPKKPIKKSQVDDQDPDKEMADDSSYDAVDKKTIVDDEDDDFDMPLDDLENFDDFGEDDDDNY